MFLTKAQLASELARCEFCEEKPCREACPANCSPADFIMAARVGHDSDLRRAAAIVMRENPLGGICGMVCPDRHCMAACSHKLFDGSIDIPTLQSNLVHLARQCGGIPEFQRAPSNGTRVAVVGGGPAGLGAAAALAQMGYEVDLFEARAALGGMCNLIPPHRLQRQMLADDLGFVLGLGAIHPKLGTRVDDPKALLQNGYAAVVVAAGLWVPISLALPHEELAIKMVDLLAEPDKFQFEGRVAVIGGGATALDCAVTARGRGASAVELFCLETLAELPLEGKERAELLHHDLEVTGRIRVTAIRERGGGVAGIDTRKVALPAGEKFHPSRVRDVAGTDAVRNDISAVVIAVGMRPAFKREDVPGLFFAGDLVNGPTTVVEAVASGKNAALEVDAHVKRSQRPTFARAVKSTMVLPGFVAKPVSLETDFFGRRILSPYLLSAAPPSDGYDQMKLAYQAGWAGGIMKTAFDGVPIHIPSQYMHAFTGTTYGNCDNVSGHPLERVCREVERLVREFPDHLTMGSTGGPVTGHDESDRKGWQSNTKKLENAGAMGIEYSLSCPQGGDGTEGDIVSQNAALTAKIIDWILEVSNPAAPKLFKLTAAVTSIVPILRAIRSVLERHPTKKAGITLANTFPTLFFRPGQKKEWEEAIVVGMSGQGVTPISYLTLASAVPVGIEISGNGGPMDYKAAMNFLALGVRTVQFCTIVMKHGAAIIQELESGTAHLMAERGIRSMKELIGRAQPKPITDFMALPATKRISHHDHDLCVKCGNCVRCPYLAVSFDAEQKLRTDPERCVGCSICVQKCFVGALSMRERTPAEAAALKEA
ncbi:MAG: FAD-dependent oxidoreductase [Candidatus Riflebacteria bacterium]|nr:FAD-dependent oxidoreductase [Candidatus Riflebacteria bacterium]